MNQAENAMFGFSVPLPSKENSLFKKALDYHSRHQYKNALKYVNQILSKPGFESHPESLGLKGIVIYILGKKKEGYDLVRKGIKCNIKSVYCWSTYGKLYQMEGSFEEAIKCIHNALRWKTDNEELLHVLSMYQIQIRDLDAFLETRIKICNIAPNKPESWIGLAVGYHLLKNYEDSKTILE